MSTGKSWEVCYVRSEDGVGQWRAKLGKTHSGKVLARRGWRTAVVWGRDRGAITNNTVDSERFQMALKI